MIYIFRRKGSTGAAELARGLLAVNVETRRQRREPRCAIGDRVVCWGDFLRTPGEALTLNNVPLRNKLTDAQILTQAGVATVEVDLAPHRGWIGRRFNHVGGHDLMRPPAQPDFYVKRERLAEEYRIHMFRGKSIRAGIKVPRANAHEWIRSFDAGWIIRYNQFNSSRPMRHLAAEAVKALELDFGAVDLARREDGELIVLEVNRAPGIEGGTVAAYAAAIKRWAEEAR